MPMWHVYTPQDAFDQADKAALSDAITRIYSDYSGLPRFYVVVVFEERPAGTVWVGGEPADNFVRIVVDHIARQMDGPEIREIAMEMIESVLEPFVKDRGYDWEIHIDETPVDLWRTQGLVPPPAESAAEQRWALENRPSIWGKDEAHLVTFDN